VVAVVSKSSIAFKWKKAILLDSLLHVVLFINLILCIMSERPAVQ